MFSSTHRLYTHRARAHGSKHLLHGGRIKAVVDNDAINSEKLVARPQPCTMQYLISLWRDHDACWRSTQIRRRDKGQRRNVPLCIDNM